MGENILDEIMRIGNLMRRHVDRDRGERKRGKPLTGRDVRMLCYLLDHGDRVYSQRALESKFGLARSTVSESLSELERQGLIVREPLEGDARQKQVRPTRQALEEHQWMQARRQRLEQTVAEEFTPQEQAQFLGYLDRTIACLARERRGKDKENQKER